MHIKKPLIHSSEKNTSPTSFFFFFFLLLLMVLHPEMRRKAWMWF